MNLVDINTLFPTEDKCRELLVRLRWPEGVQCLRCKGPVVELETNKQLFYCKECDYQFTVTSGTVFNDSHLPLAKWFLTTHLLCEAKKGMSACQVQRTVGMSYKTAWYLCHRIRHAMTQTDKPMLDGKVEMDETYIGGKVRGHGAGYAKDMKEIVIGFRKRNGDLRFFHSKDVKGGTLAQYIKDNLSEDLEVLYTDDFLAYRGAAKHLRKIGKHKTIRHKLGIYAKGDTHTNSIESAFSLFKRGIRGSWHHVSAKHLLAYLDEMSFRFNRRQKSDLFVDTLRHMVTAPVLTFEKLTA